MLDNKGRKLGGAYKRHTQSKNRCCWKGCSSAVCLISCLEQAGSGPFTHALAEAQLTLSLSILHLLLLSISLLFCCWKTTPLITYRIGYPTLGLTKTHKSWGSAHTLSQLTPGQGNSERDRQDKERRQGGEIHSNK